MDSHMNFHSADISNASGFWKCSDELDENSFMIPIYGKKDFAALMEVAISPIFRSAKEISGKDPTSRSEEIIEKLKKALKNEVKISNKTADYILNCLDSRLQLLKTATSLGFDQEELNGKNSKFRVQFYQRSAIENMLLEYVDKIKNNYGIDQVIEDSKNQTLKVKNFKENYRQLNFHHKADCFGLEQKCKTLKLTELRNYDIPIFEDISILKKLYKYKSSNFSPRIPSVLLQYKESTLLAISHFHEGNEYLSGLNSNLKDPFAEMNLDLRKDQDIIDALFNNAQTRKFLKIKYYY